MDLEKGGKLLVLRMCRFGMKYSCSVYNYPIRQIQIFHSTVDAIKCLYMYVCVHSGYSHECNVLIRFPSGLCFNANVHSESLVTCLLNQRFYVYIHR